MPRSHLLVSWHFHLAGLCMAPIIRTEHSLFLKQTCKWKWQEQLLSRWRAGHFHCFDNFSVPAILFYCKYVLFLWVFLLPKVNINHLVRCCVCVCVSVQASLLVFSNLFWYMSHFIWFLKSVSVFTNTQTKTSNQQARKTPLSSYFVSFCFLQWVLICWNDLWKALALDTQP